jgi:hypothetical protein
MRTEHDDLDGVVSLQPTQVLQRVRQWTQPSRWNPITWDKNDTSAPFLLAEADQRGFVVQCRSFLPNPYLRELVVTIEPIGQGSRLHGRLLMRRRHVVTAGMVLLVFVGLPVLALFVPWGYRNMGGLVAFLALSVAMLVVIPAVSRIVEPDTKRLRGFWALCFPEARPLSNSTPR